jgi:hypothetical protein
MFELSCAKYITIHFAAADGRGSAFYLAEHEATDEPCRQRELGA